MSISSHLKRFEHLLVKKFDKVLLVTLNRPQVLNAMTYQTVSELTSVYREICEQPAQSLVVVLKGAGVKAFSAGGDVVSYTQCLPEVRMKSAFYEYQLDHRVMHLKQPHVALWNGIVMGGGVGISVNGSHRIASEKAVFAMPETKIGLLPDVGATWFLPRLKGGLGLFLALTGHRLRGADLVHAGFATHFVPSERFDDLEREICGISDVLRLDGVVSSFVSPALPPFSLSDDLARIDEHFGPAADSIEGILHSLQRDGSDWARKQLSTLEEMCPTSLKVTFEAQRRGARMKRPAEAYALEFVGCENLMASHDFTEGVNALLVRKTGKPQWRPATLGEVTRDRVESIFAPPHPAFPKWAPQGEFPESISTTSKL